MSNTTPFGYPIPAARRVSPLRQRMIEDMRVRNFAPNTQESYLNQVSLFARHFGKSPEQLGPEEIRAYQIYLADQKKVSVNTRILAVSALRFFYAVTLQRDWTVQLIPTPKKDQRLPVILSPQEVLQVLHAAPSFPHHVIFSAMYGTGMRVSEAVHLRAANIDSQRMMIRIELSKGHKDRDVQLSPKLLELLRCYWRKVRPVEWMFPGEIPHRPLTRSAVNLAVTQAGQRAGLKKHISPHSFRHYAKFRAMPSRSEATTSKLFRYRSSRSNHWRNARHSPAVFNYRPLRNTNNLSLGR